MRTKVFYNKPPEACYGCQACSEACPVDAIKMQPDEEGFLFPRIDTDKCIECGLCERSCPTQDSVYKPLMHITPAEVDAAWEKSLDARRCSASGGVFFAIASRWVENGGVVYGAAFDSDIVVRHTRVDTLAALDSLRGSKYVQSNVQNTFREVRADLRSGLKVLYSGTPCQIAGLRSFLKKDFDNLVTIDLVCHGTPSPMVFKDHIAYIESQHGIRLKDYKFREKHSGWRAYIKYVFSDGKSALNSLGKDFYAFSFYRSRFVRRSCFMCDFSCPKRVGDITLSDFWHAEDHYKQLRLQRKYGFNMVMCNTEKGRMAYAAAADLMEHMTVPSKVAIEGDVRLRHTEDMPAERSEMFRLYRENGYEWMKTHKGYHPGLRDRLVPNWLKNIVKEIQARI